MGVLRGALTRAQRLVGGGLPENWEAKLAEMAECELGSRTPAERERTTTKRWALVKAARLEWDRLYHLAPQNFTD